MLGMRSALVGLRERIVAVKASLEKNELIGTLNKIDEVRKFGMSNAIILCGLWALPGSRPHLDALRREGENLKSALLRFLQVTETVLSEAAKPGD